MSIKSPTFLKDYEGKSQYVIKNMQETCIDVYLLSEKFYSSWEEAVADWEKEGPEFRVWCRFNNPDFIPRDKRKNSVMYRTYEWRGK